MLRSCVILSLRNVVTHSMAKKKGECFTSMTVCLDATAYDAITVYMNHLNRNVKKNSGNGMNRPDTVNKIVNEWAEDRCLTLDVTRKAR